MELLVSGDDPFSGAMSMSIDCDMEVSHDRIYIGNYECDQETAAMAHVSNQKVGACVGTIIGGSLVTCTKGPCPDEDIPMENELFESMIRWNNAVQMPQAVPQ